MTKLIVLSLLLFVFGICIPPQTQSQTTQFSYQGSLTNVGTPANGNFDFEFLLFDSITLGTQLGTTNTKSNVAVANGVFSVSLDFGNQFAAGGNRYLEIWVRPVGGGAYTPLAPRHLLTANPYAVKTISADVATNANNLNNQPASFYQNAANLNAGTLPDARIGFNIARRDVSNTFTGQNFFTSTANEFNGDGANLTNLNAANISFGTLPDGRLSSNIPKLNAANNFVNQNNFAFGERTLQIRNDGGLVPGLNLTGTSGNLGILRLRNSLEVWPSDDLSRAARVDLRNSTGAPTITMDGSSGTISAISLSASNLPAFAYKECATRVVVNIGDGDHNVTLCEVVINVPGPGFLYIEGRIRRAFFASNDPNLPPFCQSDLQFKLDEVHPNGSSSNLMTQSYPSRQGYQYEHSRVSTVQTVSGAGQKKYKLDLFRTCGSGGDTINEHIIAVWYYPSLMNVP